MISGSNSFPLGEMSEVQSGKKVLIITYYWPPAGGPGVQRWLKFVKYLPTQGWQPSVLTVQNPSVPAFDASLLADIPQGVLIRRARTLVLLPRKSETHTYGKKSLAPLGHLLYGRFQLGT